MPAVKNVLTHLDFLGAAELQNALLHKLTEAPAAVEGKVYQNTADHIARYYNGTAWKAFGLSDLVAGSALTKTGDTLDVAVAAGEGGIEVSSDALRISTGAAGNGLTGGGGSALAVNVGVGIEIASDAVRISAEAAGGGLQGGAGSPLFVGAGEGITTNANEVFVDTNVIATRAFAEALINGIDNKANVRVATTANITIATALNSGDALDGVTLANGDRVLVKDQTTKKENGIYIVAASPARATDADISAEVTSGLYVFVGEGTKNENSGWQLFTNDPITLGTTELVFEQVSGAGQITAGEALTKTGNVLDVAVGTGIKIESDKVVIDTTVVPRLGSANTFTATNTFTASTIFDSSGSTAELFLKSSSSTLRTSIFSDSTGFLLEQATGDISLIPATGKVFKVGSNLEQHKIEYVKTPTSEFDAANKAYVDGKVKTFEVGDNSATEFELEHKFGHKLVDVTVRRVASPYDEVEVYNEAITTEKVKLIFLVKPTSKQFSVKVTG